MSKIIEKAFDASKKIIRSIFKGSPNLFTTSDLNRQFEALKYQLDLLDDKTGFVSDMDVTTNYSDGTLEVTTSYSYLINKGCSFSPSNNKVSVNMTSSAPIAYLCLTAETEVVTYDTDFSHDISGAKFEDGTSRPSANQIVYKNEQFVLTHSFSIDNIVGVLAVFELSALGVSIVKNFCANGVSIPMSYQAPSAPEFYELEIVKVRLTSDTSIETDRYYKIPQSVLSSISDGDIIEVSLITQFYGAGYRTDYSHIISDIQGRILVSGDNSHSSRILVKNAYPDSNTDEVALTLSRSGYINVIYSLSSTEVLPGFYDRFNAVKAYIKILKPSDFYK